jgi:HPt (histidine-containing phosphotransfer) domain-containing protein
MSAPVDTDNLDMLKEIIGDDLKEILQAYLDSAPDLISKIDNALKSGNSEELRLHSHSLKGSSANIGANQLSGFSAGLEQMAKNQDLSSNADALFSSIETENSSVTLFLNNYIQQM